MDLNNRIRVSGKYASKEDRRFHGEISYFYKQGGLYNIVEYDMGQKLEFPVSTMDIKQDYDIMGFVSYSLDFCDQPFRRKISLDETIETCKIRLVLECRRKRGDAIIGMKIEFQNPQKNASGDEIEGKVLLYGTAVKLKE